MGRLPGSKKKVLKSATGDEGRVIKEKKRPYVRHKKLDDRREEQPSTSNETVKYVSFLLEKVMKEVQTLSMEVVEFERRAQDRYRSLMDENVYLKRKFDKLSNEVMKFNQNINKLHSKEFGTRISVSNTSGNEYSPVVEMEPQIVNGGFDDTDDDEEKLDDEVEDSMQMNTVSNSAQKNGDCRFVTNKNSKRPRKRRAAANKREGDYANMLKQKLSINESKKSTADTSKINDRKAKISRIESDDGSEWDEVNDNSKEKTEISQWKLFKHIKIKPQRTDLPKPIMARSNGGRNVHFTDEWKQYATTIYPIDPSRYWNLAQSEYDRLIPDSDLEMYAKNPDKTEKEHFVRSIYDWFRSQHRIAQLRVVLSECDEATDLDSLWDIYVAEMKRRGWPIYGRRLRKGEVTIAKQQMLEDFIDCNI